MSDEEDSMSEGFSASEDEWKPAKDVKGGESSDDDDSDFEVSPIEVAASDGVSGAAAAGRKRGEPKARSAAKQTSSKKRSGLSLRAKLYNKYRPPPKTCSPPRSGGAMGNNSPSASTSRVTKSKNSTAPNESENIKHKNYQKDNDDGNDTDSSSGSSIDNYLVHPEDLDIQSSFFNVEARAMKKPSVSPVPVFDCNAGIGNLTDSESEGEEKQEEEAANKQNTNAFDFKHLLDYANNLEQVKENLKQVAAESAANSKKASGNIDTLDVYAVLALGEKLQNRSHNDGEDEDDEDDDGGGGGGDRINRRSKAPPSKLNKTKSTRIKRHTKTRPTSTVAADETDDSDWEEVAESSETLETTANDSTHSGNLEIHVELPSKQREKKTKTQQDLEMALKRKLNRDIKERQILFHKASLLCHFGRTFFYNRLLNDTKLMQKTLKLLPSPNAYPPDRGTEIKYYQSLVTWFKSAIKLTTQNLYPEKSAAKTKAKAQEELLKQIEKKEAYSKQDMIFIFVILLRGMGIQCRLVVNMQPLPLKPAQSDLLTIKLKKEDEGDDINASSVKAKKTKKNEGDSDKNDTESKATTSTSRKAKVVTKDNKIKEVSQIQDDIKKDRKEVASTSKKIISKEKSSKTDHQTSDKAEIKNKIQLTKLKSASSEVNREASFEERPKGPTGKKSSKTDHQTTDNAETKNKIQLKKLKSASSEVNRATSFEERPKGPTGMKSKQTSEKKLNADKTKQSAENSLDLCVTKNQTPQSSAGNVKQVSEQISKNKTNIEGVSTARPIRKKNHELTEKEKESTATANSSTTLENKVPIVREKQQAADNHSEELESSQKENTTKSRKNPNLDRLKRSKAMDVDDHDVDVSEQKSKKNRPVIKVGSPVVPKIVIQAGKDITSSNSSEQPTTTNAREARSIRSRSRSKSPQIHISTAFLTSSQQYKEKFPGIIQQNINTKTKPALAKAAINKVKISTEFMQQPQKRVLRSRQKTNESEQNDESNATTQIPQLDGGHDELAVKSGRKKRAVVKKIKAQRSTESSEEDFEPSPPKKPKTAPAKTKPDRRVLSTDDEDGTAESPERAKRRETAGDMWVEVWSDLEEQWICVDLFKGKLHCVDTIRKSASPNMAYVFAFQNDLSIKDVTARYCPSWTSIVRKSRVDKGWLDTAITHYLGRRTKRDINEDQELRRIHEQKPMPTAIGDYKNHPFYALERHLLKFEALYPPAAPPLGYIRGEAVYSRDCVHTLHSREIWLKQARTVKLGERPYKVVKARPKWCRITQTVIKDLPCEIFGYWQTQDYEPPTAENGFVPRNAYGNVELFKACMLPKKTVHLRLNGLNRVCKKLNVDCANAVVGFDFHQGACHPTYDGFIICEEFQDQVVAAWHQDQEDQERKEQDKYEARVYGNWKKLIRGLQIRERLKLKYNF